MLYNQLLSHTLKEIITLGVYDQLEGVLSHVEWELLERKYQELEDAIRVDYEDQINNTEDLEEEIDNLEDKLYDAQQEINELHKLLEENNIEY